MENTMRGLKERVAFANARVMFVIDEHKAEHELAQALSDAERLGVKEMGNMSFEDVPKMFADEPLLVSAWEDGFQKAQSSVYASLANFYRSTCACQDCKDDADLHFDRDDGPGFGCRDESGHVAKEAFKMGQNSFVRKTKMPVIFSLDDKLANQWNLGFKFEESKTTLQSNA